MIVHHIAERAIWGQVGMELLRMDAAGSVELHQMGREGACVQTRDPEQTSYVKSLIAGAREHNFATRRTARAQAKREHYRRNDGSTHVR